ncbi:MAG: hypothetical protein GX071_05510 [Gammaproteobacteria bacterium]|nr:hypothetical protein [Gammaproteobacteria bacterium]
MSRSVMPDERLRQLSAAGWLMPLVLVALVLLYFSPMLLGSEDFDSDGQLAAYAQPWQWWSSSWATGWPVTGDPLSMALYPLRLLLVALQAPFDVFVVMAYLVAVLGMYAYLRCLVDRLPAAFGALAFSLSGWMLVHLGHTSMVHTAAWLPWIMLGVHQVCAGRRSQQWLGAALLALSVGMSLLAGHAQITVYALLLAGCYGLLLVLSQRAWSGLLFGALGVALGVALVTPALLPAMEWTGHTLRSELSREELFSYAFPLSEAPGLMVPLLYGSTAISWLGIDYRTPAHLGETVTFLPAIGGLLCLLALLAPVQRRHVVFAACYALLALLLATGDRFALAGLITENVFPLNMFRASSRHLLEVTFCFSVLAAIGLQALGDGRLSRRRIRLGALLLMLLLGVAILLALAFGPLMAWPSDKMLGPMLLAAAAVALALVVLFWRARGKLPVAGLALLLLLGQTWLIGYQLPWYRLPQSMLGKSAQAWAADFQSELGQDYRGLAMDGWEARLFNPDVSRLHGVNTLGWYGPLLNRSVVQLTGLTSGGWIQRFVLAQQDVTLDLLAVRLVALPAAQQHLVEGQPERWRFAGVHGDEYLYENTRVLPRARLVCSTQRLDDDEAFVRAVRRGRLELSVADTGYINDQAVELRAAGADCAGQVRIIQDRGHVLRIEADVVSGQALLIIADLWYPGWTARVQGELRPVLRVNNTSRGVVLDQGRTELELVYRPSRWGLSLMVSLLSVGLLLGAVTAGLLCRRRESAGHGAGRQ